MNAQLRLPNAQDFATIKGAADMLGVHVNSVKRYLKAGTLTAYHPVGAAQGDTRALLLSTAEVRQLVEARKIIGR